MQAHARFATGKQKPFTNDSTPRVKSEQTRSTRDDRFSQTRTEMRASTYIASQAFHLGRMMRRTTAAQQPTKMHETHK